MFSEQSPKTPYVRDGEPIVYVLTTVVVELSSTEMNKLVYRWGGVFFA